MPLEDARVTATVLRLQVPLRHAGMSPTAGETSQNGSGRRGHAGMTPEHAGATRTVLGFGLAVRYAGATATMVGELGTGVRLQ